MQHPTCPLCLGHTVRVYSKDVQYHPSDPTRPWKTTVVYACQCDCVFSKKFFHDDETASQENKPQ
jgi:hypothetical protein